MSEEETMTCGNCKLKIASQNYIIHTLHCTRHLELCNKCGEPVPKEKLTEHIETEHANENCSVCGESMEKGLLEKHAETDCPKRLVACHYCELELPLTEMMAHTDYCGTRTEKCPECEEFVMLKYTQLHLGSNHKFLKLKDEPGPSASWEETVTRASHSEFKTLENGEATLLPCEFCEGMFTPRELRRHQVSCTLGWDTTIPVLRTISVIRCENCGKSIAAEEYEAHTIICDEHSPSIRSKNQRSNRNVVGYDVRDSTVPFSDYKSYYNGSSEYPSNSVVSENTQATSERRKDSVIPCDLCNKSIPFKDYQRHRIFCMAPTSEAPSTDTDDHFYSYNDSILKLPCEFCEKSFSPERLDAHQIGCSPIGQQINIPCELCGELKSLAEVVNHQLTCRVSGDH